MAKCSNCDAPIPDAADACPSCGWICDRRDADQRAGDVERSGRFANAMRDLHDGPAKRNGSSGRAVVAFVLTVLIAAVALWFWRR